MHLRAVLIDIYKEHHRSVELMVETLLDMDVPTEDAKLLGVMPWEYPANRIAVERERLGLSPMHPLLHFELPPSAPTWLTPALMAKMFQLAPETLDEPLVGAAEDDEAHEDRSVGTLVLPS